MANDPYQFVKDTGRDKYWQTREKERDQLGLLDPDTGELKKELSQYVKCVVCQSDEQNFAFMKEGFRIVKCCKCGLLFVNPRPDESRIVASYNEEESRTVWLDVLLTEAQQSYDAEHRFGEGVRRLEKLYPKSERGRVLDIGCSIGLFLKLMRERGWDPHGMEVNQKARQNATEVYGIPVDAKLLHEVDYPKEYFQVVSMWGVLEHTANPDEILDQIYPMLDSNGTLVILVPNGHSLATRIMHEHSPTFGKDHLWYFTPDTITTLLERKGYEVAQLYTQLSQIDELTHFLRYNNPYLPGKEVAFEEFSISDSLQRELEEFIEKNHLGYKLIVLAQKKKS